MNSSTNPFADELDTFIVYNERKKVTSSAKKRRKHGDKLLQQVLINTLFYLLIFYMLRLERHDFYWRTSLLRDTLFNVLALVLIKSRIYVCVFLSVNPYFNFWWQTPDGSLLDITRNAYDLLSHCGIAIPKVDLPCSVITLLPYYLS